MRSLNNEWLKPMVPYISRSILSYSHVWGGCPSIQDPIVFARSELCEGRLTPEAFSFICACLALLVFLACWLSRDRKVFLQDMMSEPPKVGPVDHLQERGERLSR